MPSPIRQYQALIFSLKSWKSTGKIREKKRRNSKGEEMEFGFLSIIPPIVAIALALITKEVITSVLIGIIS